jgi:hypothetical protein
LSIWSKVFDVGGDHEHVPDVDDVELLEQVDRHVEVVAVVQPRSAGPPAGPIGAPGRKVVPMSKGAPTIATSWARPPA